MFGGYELHQKWRREERAQEGRRKSKEGVEPSFPPLFDRNRVYDNSGGFEGNWFSFLAGVVFKGSWLLGRNRSLEAEEEEEGEVVDLPVSVNTKIALCQGP